MHGPWLALHGFGGSGTDFDLLRPHLDLVCPDLLGHGVGTSAGASAPYSMAEAVEAVLEAHPGRHHVMGYSMGGRVALHLALAAPERVDRLVLIGATPGLEGEAATRRREADDALANTIEERGSTWFADTWREVPIIRSQERIESPWREQLRARRAQQDAHGLASSLKGMGTGAMPSVWDRLGELQCPVLLVTGVEDHKFTAIAGRMVERIPRAEHVVLPGAGHCAHLEAPQAFVEALRDWSF